MYSQYQQQYLQGEALAYELLARPELMGQIPDHLLGDAIDHLSVAMGREYNHLEGRFVERDVDDQAFVVELRRGVLAAQASVTGEEFGRY